METNTAHVLSDILSTKTSSRPNAAAVNHLVSIQLAAMASGSKWYGIMDCFAPNIYKKLLMKQGRQCRATTKIAHHLLNLFNDIDIAIDIWKIIVSFLATKEECYFALAKCESEKHYIVPLCLGYLEGILVTIFIIFSGLYDTNSNFTMTRTDLSYKFLYYATLTYCCCIIVHIFGILSVCLINLNESSIERFKLTKSNLYESNHSISTSNSPHTDTNSTAVIRVNSNSLDAITPDEDKRVCVRSSVGTDLVEFNINNKDYILNLFDFPKGSTLLVNHGFCYYWELYIPFQHWSNLLQITIFDSLYDNNSFQFKFCLILKIVLFKYMIAVLILFFPIKMLNGWKFGLNEEIEVSVSFCFLFSIVISLSWILLQRWKWGIENSHLIMFQHLRRKFTIAMIVVMIVSLTFFYNNGSFYFWLFLCSHIYFLVLQTFWQSLSRRLQYGSPTASNRNGNDRAEFAYLNLSFDCKQRGRCWQFMRCMLAFWYFPVPIEFKNEKNSANHTVVVHPY